MAFIINTTFLILYYGFSYILLYPLVLQTSETSNQWTIHDFYNCLIHTLFGKDTNGVINLGKVTDTELTAIVYILPKITKNSWLPYRSVVKVLTV